MIALRFAHAYYDVTLHKGMHLGLLLGRPLCHFFFGISGKGTNTQSEFTEDMINSCCLFKTIGDGVTRCSRWRLLPEVPYLVYLTDLKVVFVVTAVYTSLISQFRNLAVGETERNLNSGVNFKINSYWSNHSIEGGVSDSILWKCREDSSSRHFYLSLYGGLFSIFGSVVILYFIFRLAIVILTCKIACHIVYPGVNVNYLVLVANSLKKIYQLKKRLSDVHVRDKIETQEAVITQIAHEWQNEWKMITVTLGVQYRMLVRWITTLYVIPMIENCIILALLILILTSFDVHPLGCFFDIDIHYEELTKTVTLRFSNVVHNYQKVAVVVALIICVFWIFLKWIQSSLLPDAYQTDNRSIDYGSHLYPNSEDEVVDQVEEVEVVEKLDGNPLSHEDNSDIASPFKEITSESTGTSCTVKF